MKAIDRQEPHIAISSAAAIKLEVASEDKVLSKFFVSNEKHLFMKPIRFLFLITCLISSISVSGLYFDITLAVSLISEFFIFSTNFEREFSINQKVALRARFNRV